MTRVGSAPGAAFDFSPDSLQAALQSAGAPGAIAVVDLDRDEAAGFRLQVRPIGVDPIDLPPREALLELLPAGSGWAAAVGWGGFYGWPLPDPHSGIWVLGAQWIRARTGGGAHPVMRAFLHRPGGWSDRLRELARAVHPSGDHDRPDPVRTRVSVRSLRGVQAVHTGPEQAAILRGAAAAFQHGARPAFRTASLSEGDTAPLVRWRPRLPGTSDCVLLGVPDALAGGLSWRTKVFVVVRGLRSPP